MGVTLLFELFTGLLSLHLNPVSVVGGVIPENIAKGTTDPRVEVILPK